jgi:hypothetical protein
MCKCGERYEPNRIHQLCTSCETAARARDEAGGLPTESQQLLDDRRRCGAIRKCCPSSAMRTGSLGEGWTPLTLVPAPATNSRLSNFSLRTISTRGLVRADNGSFSIAKELGVRSWPFLRLGTRQELLLMQLARMEAHIFIRAHSSRKSP